MQVVDVNGNMFGYDHLEIIGPDGRPKNIISTTYVPYTGAITDVDLGAHSLKADYLEVDQNTVHVVSTAQIGWNETDGTFDMGMLNGVTLQAGQELHFYAKATEAITNGQAVQFAGAQGSHLLIKRAVPSEINANPEYFVGVATQNFATNDFGYVTSFGKVRDLNTLAYPEGTILYFAAGGSTPGALTATEPSAPYAKIIVAAVVRSHGTQGALFVRPHVMPKIEDIQDVNVTGATSGQVLTYNGSIWVPTTPTTGTVTSVTASAPLSSSGGSTPNITISQASGTDDGYLSSADWSTFNSKQPAGNYITALSGEATGSGPGTASVTLNNASVTAKVLTGVNITGGSISASDTILTAFGKLQNQINGLIGSSVYQGTWNASTNTPALASGVGTRGYYYIVNVAGSTNLDGITDWNVGDWAIFDGTAWQQVDNTDSVTSVNGQTGAVSLTTDNIPEGATNLYFTQPRARQSISLTTSGSSGAATYNNGTGVFNIPNYTLSGLGGVPTSRRLEINGISYDLSADRSWSVGTVTSIATSGPITGGTITGSGTIGINQASATDDGYLSSTDWNTFNNKQNAITLTTTGTSGAATFIGSTLNIPQYQSVITNPVTGTGAANYVARWTSSSNIGTGILYDTGSLVGVNTTAPGKTLDVFGDVRFQSTNSRIDFTTAYNGLNDLPAGILLSTWSTANNNLGIIPSAQGTVGSKVVLGAYNGSVWRSMVEFANTSGEPNLLLVKSAGNVLLGTTSIAGPYGNPKMLIIGGSTPLIASNGDNSGTYLQINTGAANGVVNLQADARTGDYPPLTITTGGSEKMRITAGGSVGIGTTNPVQALSVIGNIYQRTGDFITWNNGDAQIGAVSGYALAFSTYDGSSSMMERMRITSAGNVGIGTTSPSYKLHVQDNANVGTIAIGHTTYPGLLYSNAGTGEFRIDNRSSAGAGYITFYPNGQASSIGTEAMRINTAGSIRFNQYGSGSFTGTRAYDLAVDSSGNLIEVPVGAGTVTGSGTANYVARWTSSSNISTGILYDNGVNVGVNTTTPDRSLSVVGTMGVASASNNVPELVFFTHPLFISISSTYKGSSSFVPIFFETGGLERMRITTGGNIGIGTTSPQTKLTISGANVPYAGQLQIASNDYAQISFYNSGSLVPGASNRKASIIYNVPNSTFEISNQITSGHLILQGSDSGGGRVGIGTDSPSSKLDVAGTISNNSSQNIIYSSYDAVAALFQRVGTYGSVIQIGRLGVSNSVTIDYPNDGTFAISTAGSEKMRITPAGNVGIGTTAPASKLHLSGTTTLLTITDTTYNRTSAIGYLDDANLYLANDGGSNTYIGRYNNVFLAYGGGSVGVGTTNTGVYPFAAKLNVAGNISINGTKIGWGVTDSFTLNGIDTAHYGLSSNFNLVQLSGYYGLVFATTGYERMRISDGGNVGIGVTNPSYKLHVYDTGTSTARILIQGETNYSILQASNNSGSLYAGMDNSSGTGFGSGSYSRVIYSSGNYPLIFFTNDAERMRIIADGRVGIGTSSPTQRLSVIGNIYANGGFIGYRNDGGIGLEVNGGDLGTGSFIAKFNDYNNTSKVVINGVGDVGIGTTTPTKYMSSTETLMSIVNSNVASLYLYSTTGHLYNMSSIAAGDLIWYDVSAGTERMRLTGLGNFGIGTSSPTYKLEVNGNVLTNELQYTKAININGADLNNVVIAGFYNGESLTNAPSSGWFWITVEKYSGDNNWAHQTATSFGSGNTPNEIYSRVRQGGTWTAWKKISYSTDTPTATSVYDLLPNARVDFNWVGQVIDGTWVDIFTRANNVLTSGTWMVNMYVTDYSTGGEHYQYTYSGTFTWYQGGTNQSGTPAASEIALHRMGHAANSTVLYLRTTEETAADGGDGKFQISANYSHFANTTINFKFVKII